MRKAPSFSSAPALVGVCFPFTVVEAGDIAAAALADPVWTGQSVPARPAALAGSERRAEDRGHDCDLLQLSEVRSSPDRTSGEIVSVRTNDDFRILTTVARHGSRLMAVNARFHLGIPGPAGGEYELVVLSR